jgi:molybdate transport system ATP-binding protein
VALARALVVEPDLLLLDEPLSALDVSTRVDTRRSLARHLHQFAGPRLLITHDPTEAFLLADTIYIIEQGAITQVGTSREIMMRPRTAYAADLVGVNLLVGRAQAGTVHLDGGQTLQVADASVAGPVLATIHPRSIALYRQRPDGSPRNTWPARVELVEALGDRVRIGLGPPVPLTAEVTSASHAALNLAPGTEIWVAIKATEILIEPGE